MDSEVRRAASEGQKYDTFVSVRRPAAEQRWVKAAAAAVWICVGLVATALCLNWAVPREQQEHVADSKSYLVDTHECQEWPAYCLAHDSCLQRFHNGNRRGPVRTDYCRDYQRDCEEYCVECDCPNGLYGFGKEGQGGKTYCEALNDVCVLGELQVDPSGVWPGAEPATAEQEEQYGSCEWSGQGYYTQANALYPACPASYTLFGAEMGGFCCSGTCTEGDEGLAEDDTLCALDLNPEPQNTPRCAADLGLSYDQSKLCMLFLETVETMPMTWYSDVGDSGLNMTDFNLKLKMLYHGEAAGPVFKVQDVESPDSTSMYWLRFDNEGYANLLEVADGAAAATTDVRPGALTVLANSVEVSCGDPFYTYVNLTDYGPTMNRGGYDKKDVTAVTWVDFDASLNPTEGQPEMIFEVGGTKQGFSLVYENGNRLVAQSRGKSKRIARIEYQLTAEQMAKGAIPLAVSYRVVGTDQQTFTLFVDFERKEAATQTLSKDWTGVDMASWGKGPCDTSGFVRSRCFEGGYSNRGIDAVDLVSATIDESRGLKLYNCAFDDREMVFKQDEAMDISIFGRGNQIRAFVNQDQIVEYVDTSNALAGGAFGFATYKASMKAFSIRIFDGAENEFEITNTTNAVESAAAGEPTFAVALR